MTALSLAREFIATADKADAAPSRLPVMCDSAALRQVCTALIAAEERLNTPEIHDFAKAIVLEAAHQRERWGTDHDGGKTPADWFWLIGYLAGKALNSVAAKDHDKALHHVITTAAACANWHAAMLGQTNMRPGIEPPAIRSQAKGET